MKESNNGYLAFLKQLKSTRRHFSSFLHPRKPGIFLRLDVDFEPAWALWAARIHQKLGLRATFFIQITSPFYNISHPETEKNVRAIGEAGQWIGLHYWHQGGKLDHSRLKDEAGRLSRISRAFVPVVAWHNPPPYFEAINQEANRCGFLSAYDPKYFSKERYISDSLGRNDGDAILHFVRLAVTPAVQILLHPVYWYFGLKDPADRITSAWRFKTERLIQDFSANRLWQETRFKQVTQKWLSLWG